MVQGILIHQLTNYYELALFLIWYFYGQYSLLHLITTKDALKKPSNLDVLHFRVGVIWLEWY